VQANEHVPEIARPLGARAFVAAQHVLANLQGRGVEHPEVVERAAPPLLQPLAKAVVHGTFKGVLHGPSGFQASEQARRRLVGHSVKDAGKRPLEAREKSIPIGEIVVRDRQRHLAQRIGRVSAIAPGEVLAAAAQGVLDQGGHHLG